MPIRRLLPLLLFVAACSDPQAPTGGDFVGVQTGGPNVEYSPADEAVAERMRSMAVVGAAVVEGFFGLTLGRSYTLRIASDRTTLEADWSARYGRPAGGFQCWMIANADVDVVMVLSPRVWSSQACGHAVDDASVAGVIAHELVHVLHRRTHSDPRLPGLAGSWWLYEGLAELASGRYGDAQAAQARSALRSAPPRELEQVLGTGGGYALAGSLGWYIDQIYGREGVVLLLSARNEAEILSQLGVEEPALLASWAEYMLSSGVSARP